uniref:Uncharacterized protein n=1 Tax=Lepeophtheirus salmonis TaxID=72036 RepID=A0A0K2TQS2_LEPSM
MCFKYNIPHLFY